MITDNMIHVAELVIIGLPLWLNLFRQWGIFKDFPPHRHVGKRIMYPANVDKEQFDTVIGNGEK